MRLKDYEAWWRAEVPDPDEARSVRKLLEEAKEVRDAVKADDHEEILLELGDVLAFVTLLAHCYGYNLENVMDANIEKLNNRNKYGKHNHGVRS